jgi:hypothetical protein
MTRPTTQAISPFFIVTGFHVASVHSIFDLSDISPFIRCKGRIPHSLIESHTKRVQYVAWSDAIGRFETCDPGREIIVLRSVRKQPAT